MSIKPEAIFDTLYIGSRIESKLKDFSQYEIQFFAYLSCLLSLYDGNLLTFWEYDFIKSQLGSPFSYEIQKAWMDLRSSSSIKETTDGYYRLTEIGKSKISFFLNLRNLKGRAIYLDAACKSLSLIPLNRIKEAILNEPVLRSASLIKRKSLLNEKSPATQELHSQFGMLKEALQEEGYNNLLIPAVVWIESLREDIITENLPNYG